MVDVVLKYQTHLRIEDRTVLRHQAQLGVGHEGAVLALRAAGERRRANALRTNRVDHRAKSLRLGFAADGSDLLIRQRLRAAGAESRRGEEFDDVRALCFELTHLRAKGIRWWPRRAELRDRRQNSRTRNC